MPSVQCTTQEVFRVSYNRRAVALSSWHTHNKVTADINESRPNNVASFCVDVVKHLRDTVPRMGDIPERETAHHTGPPKEEK